MIYTNFEIEERLTAAGYKVELKGTDIYVSSNDVQFCKLYKNGCGKVMIWFCPVVHAAFHDWNGHVYFNNNISYANSIFSINERYAKYRTAIYRYYYLMKAWGKTYSAENERFVLRETHLNSFIDELIAFAPTLIEHVKEAYKDYKQYVAERNLKRFHTAIED